MKKKLLFIPVLFIVAVFLGIGSVTAYAAKKNIPVTSVKMSISSTSMTQGDTLLLTVKINPSNATNRTIKWSSTNTAIATVSGNGTVTAVQTGSCVITAKTSNNKTSKCSIKVNAARTQILSVSPISVTTTAGIAPVLPDTVSAKMSDGTTKSVSVIWSYFSSDKYAQEGTFTVNGTAESTNVTATVTVKAEYYSEGSYKVGKDIPAGEYVLVGFGTNSQSGGQNYGSFTTTSAVSGSGEDHFYGRYIITLTSDQTITFTTIKMYPIASAPKVGGGSTLSAGMYKVGTDLTPGTYTLINTNDSYYGYYEIDKDDLHMTSSTVKSDHFPGTVTVSLTAGEYLYFDWGMLQPQMSDEDYLAYLNSQWGSLTLDGQTVNFTWEYSTVTGYNKTITAAVTDISQYKIWQNWLKGSKSDKVQGYFNDFAKAITQNFPNKTVCSMVCYVGDYKSYPSDFTASDSTQISTNSDGTYHVLSVMEYVDNSTTAKLYS